MQAADVSGRSIRSGGVGNMAALYHDCRATIGPSWTGLPIPLGRPASQQ
jgi:hypothetical protein